MGSHEERDSHFRKLQQFTPDYCPSRLTLYESARTGMRVAVVDQEGPKLQGFFALATEIHDDSGAPHTLEHLCFMGSKHYQYKGFLDKLATRAYSSTNAWTATDHTAYTLDTAGWAGFRQLLPVYLEHIILPTLTDAGCTTEVFHIDGTGNDAGVVYSEMQAVQNTAAELMELRAKRLLYPAGVGFRYETGGMMEQLRVLTADRIRQFHRDMYQPKNLCLIITGELDHGELLDTLDNFETSIMPFIPDPAQPFPRPWVESKQAPWLSQSMIERVEFPEEDETTGHIDIRYLGPDVADYTESAALNVILLYLTGSSASPLDNVLVEKEALTSGVYFQINQRPKTDISFSLSSVATEKLEVVEKRFHQVLQDVVRGKLDMSFLKDCLERQVRTVKFAAETSPATFTDMIIADYLFCDRNCSSFAEMKDLTPYTKVLTAWTEEQWKMFIRKYLVDAHYVSVLGVPSASLAEKMQQDEVTRVEEQQKRLGPEGLKKKAEELEQARTENDREIPPELLAQFKVPPTDSIHFITTAAARAGPALRFGRPDNKYQRLIEPAATETPLFIAFQHIPSNFARISLLVSTETIPLDLLPLLAIWLEALFNLPVRRGDRVIEFENVVIELESDTVGYRVDSAEALGNAECLRIAFQVEVDKYKVAITWIKELLWATVFDVQRLITINARLLADIPDNKRSGDSMLMACHNMIHLAPQSISRAKSTLVKALYLKGVKRLLTADPQQVVDKLELLRSHLCRFENFRVVVIADLEKLSDPVRAWQTLLDGLDTTPPPNPLGKRRERLSAEGRHMGKLAYVVPMPTVDSSYANAITNGLTSYDDPRLPAFLVAMAYLNATEGPLWTSVRGNGLAYGANMTYDLESGFLYFDIYRSPDAYKAFEAGKRVIQSHISGEVDFDPLMLEGAISSIVVSFASEQSTLASAAAANFVQTVMRGLPEDHRESLLRQVRAIEVAQVRECFQNTIFDLFVPDKANILVTCAPGLQEAIKSGLVSAGFNPEIRDLASFQDDYGLKVDGVDEDEDNDDDDDDDGDGDGDDDGTSSDYEMVDKTETTEDPA